MDWTIFGNIANTLAALVTIGAPIFSIFRAVLRSKQNIVFPQPQANLQLNQTKAKKIPWYIWIKVVGRTFSCVFTQPMILFVYLMMGGLCMGGIFIFCFLVGIPTARMNDTGTGLRLLILCTLLVFSLHYSIEFAEHSEEFLYEEVTEYNKRVRRMQRQF